MMPSRFELSADGPAIVFGGPGGNLEAFEALIVEAGRLGVPPSRVISTGGVADEAADATAAVGRVRGSGVHVVKGDRDRRLADAELDAESRAFLTALPDRIDLVIAGRRLAVVH